MGKGVAAGILPGRIPHCGQSLGGTLQESLLPDSVSVQFTTSHKKGHGAGVFGRINPHSLQVQGGPLHRNQGITPEGRGYSSTAAKRSTKEELHPSSGSSLEKMQALTSLHQPGSTCMK